MELVHKVTFEDHVWVIYFDGTHYWDLYLYSEYIEIRRGEEISWGHSEGVPMVEGLPIAKIPAQEILSPDFSPDEFFALDHVSLIVESVL